MADRAGLYHPATQERERVTGPMRFSGAESASSSLLAPSPSARPAALMPHQPQSTAMSADEFRALLKAANMPQHRAAKLLGVGQPTVFRWLNGETPISEERAALIRERIKPEVK